VNNIKEHQDDEE